MWHATWSWLHLGGGGGEVKITPTFMIFIHNNLKIKTKKITKQNNKKEKNPLTITTKMWELLLNWNQVNCSAYGALAWGWGSINYFLSHINRQMQVFVLSFPFSVQISNQQTELFDLDLFIIRKFVQVINCSS